MKKYISWGLIVILGISFLLLWAYSNELKNKVIKLEDYSNLAYFSETSNELLRYEQLLAYEKAYLAEGKVDLELFKKINTAFFLSPVFPIDFNSETVIEMNQFRNEINLSITLFQKALTDEERQKHINTFETSLIKYKEKFYQLAQSRGYCSDYNDSFCPE
ncbi:hypothetical protein LAV72_16120 [Lysinibacillus xylanilyticus]|uniref:hypothetical protein n=1 Tax=Lysinibacillus xylanilyticus TaxID=582475 RepID=UPI002B250BDE|nr:hypothetical protein [Lysinibacillus xylanilyticus]MEB2301144.1 hypothetical protein [Lysinibacillus xylanilyticus]